MRLASVVPFVAGVALVAGCRDAGTAAAPPTHRAPEPAAQQGIPARTPLTPEELPTDDPAIALGNLEGELATARQLLARSPKSAAVMALLAETLLTHGALLGRLAEYDEASRLADAAVKRAPSMASAWMARAAVRARFHRFDDALADLAVAERLGAGGRELDQRRGACLQAKGRLAEARAMVTRWAAGPSSFASLFAIATLDADEGRLEEAEQNFHAAQQRFRDVSPFPLARLWLQEALMWMDAGRPARARELLEAAHRRVPMDAAVITHLSAAYVATREPELAIPLLRPLVETSDDPEAAAQLAELLSDQATDGASAAGAAQANARAQSQALLARATARFDELVAAHPEAFADHAAHHLLRSGGDVARAARLADENLKVRRTEAAFSLAIEAHLAAGEASRACELAAEAVAALPRFAHLHVMAAKAYSACGQPGKADVELDASRHPARRGPAP